MKRQSTSENDPSKDTVSSNIYDYRAIAAVTDGHSSYAILRGIASHLKHRLYYSNDSDDWLMFSIRHYLTPKNDIISHDKNMYISTILSTFTVLHWMISSPNQHHHNLSHEEHQHDEVDNNIAVDSSPSLVVLKIIQLLASLLCHLYNQKEKDASTNDFSSLWYQDESNKLTKKHLIGHLTMIQRQ